jgi:hypothetical protein
MLTDFIKYLNKEKKVKLSPYCAPFVSELIHFLEDKHQIFSKAEQRDAWQKWEGHNLIEKLEEIRGMAPTIISWMESTGIVDSATEKACNEVRDKFLEVLDP